MEDSEIVKLNKEMQWSGRVVERCDCGWHGGGNQGFDSKLCVREKLSMKEGAQPSGKYEVVANQKEGQREEKKSNSTLQDNVHVSIIEAPATALICAYASQMHTHTILISTLSAWSDSMQKFSPPG